MTSPTINKWEAGDALLVEHNPRGLEHKVFAVRNTGHRSAATLYYYSFVVPFYLLLLYLHTLLFLLLLLLPQSTEGSRNWSRLVVAGRAKLSCVARRRRSVSEERGLWRPLGRVIGCECE
jgi:hypothetical protein